MDKRIIKIDIQGIEKTFSYPELKILFKGEIDDSNDPDNFEIKIYNLTESTSNKIKQGAIIRIQAGKENDFGTFQIGKIQKVNSYKKGRNYITEILMDTGDLSLSTVIINESFNPPINTKQILERIIPRGKLEVGPINLKNNVSYQRGKVVRGKLISVIKQLAKESQTQVIIQNGIITFSNDTIKKAFKLGAKTGLISRPKKVSETNSNSDLIIKMIFDHRVKLGSLIILESETANGQFKITKAKFNDDFTIDAELEAV